MKAATESKVPTVRTNYPSTGRSLLPTVHESICLTTPDRGPLTVIEPSRVLEVLDAAECRRLLAGAVLGRIGFTEAALPAIQPVHFVFHQDQIIIPTRAGSRLAAANHGAVVAFEVDDYDPHQRTGWNVTAVGKSRLARVADEVAAFDALGVRAWVPVDEPCYIVVAVAHLQGRRIRIDCNATDNHAQVPSE